jgi:hypothetical protein
MDELTFSVANKEYKVRKPTAEQKIEARKYYNLAFNAALRTKSPLKAEVLDLLKERGLWNDAKQEELKQAEKEVLEKEYVLHKGGITKSAARQVAIELKKARIKLQNILAPVTNFYQFTCEGQAENAKFDYLVSVCVVYDNNAYFQSYEDYVSKKESDAVAIVGSNKFAELEYKLTDDFEAELPENQFLKQYNYVDEKYRLIDDKGRLISEDGRLVNEEGNIIDEDGDLVDLLGHKLDKDGNFAVERQPFLDDSEVVVKKTRTKDKTN